MDIKITLLLILIHHLENASSMTDNFDSLNNIYNEMKNSFEYYSRNHNFNFPENLKASWTAPSFLKISENTPPTYDFIVVGSGAAGSVITNRLTENPSWEVLLLEVGKGENKFSRIPLTSPSMQFSHYNWGYLMEYQPNMCTGLNYERMHWPRGRALGGTSVINYMIYTRGNRHDFDRWAAHGNPGWSWNEVLPYYIKSEKTRLEELDPRFHGRDGYLSTENIYRSKLVDAFIESGRELYLDHIDYNANIQSFGVSRVQANVLNGQRHSNARAFLHPIRDRKNFHLLTSAYVTRILINPDTKEAYGVEYYRNGVKHTALARREVILSAGAFNSPQLLMLAGIGPADHLSELGIPILHHLPGVGQNLHDHLTFVGLSFLIDRDISLSPQKMIDPRNIFNYLVNGKGPWSSLGGVEGIGYVKTALSDDPLDIPDIELLFIDGSLTSDYGLFTRVGMNIQDRVYDGLFRPIHDIPNWTIFPMLLHPRSTGYMRLKSKNPFDYPRFYGNFFTDPEDHDINTFVAAIRYVQQIANTTVFRKLGSRLNPNHMPGCEEFFFDSDDYWKCALRSISVTLHHQVGTAKMGPRTDPMAVVDNQLRVHGIKRLRVADCSIIPFAIGAHTNAPSTMIGEKAADYIKATWGWGG